VKRKFMILSVALGAAGLLLAAGEAGAQPGAAPAAPGASALPATRPTIAVFNMAAVMRDFGQAKYQVWLLNNRKNDLSKNLIAMRGEYIKIQSELKQNPKDPRAEEKGQQLLALARQIEDEDRKISKQLNDDASSIICELYDKMKAVVDKTAELNGYHIVFAYPDAVTPEELKSAYIKELKLKPPAAQPFYVAPHADITAVVVKVLNEWYPPVDPVTKQRIDITKLQDMHPPAPAGTGGAPLGGSQLPPTNNPPPPGGNAIPGVRP
jgi:Skp family chaperone for outer membrane proteins